MFVPVNCSQCGKPFQVPESSLGQLAPCPWCAASVATRPASAPATQQQELLSLDDEPQPVSRPVAKAAPPPAGAAPPDRRSVSIWRLLVVGLLAAVVVSLITVAALKRKSGLFISADWKTFRVPDGSCVVDLPGTPTEDQDAPGAGGRRYSAEGWYSGAKAWVAWKELTPAEVQMANAPEAWQLLRPTVLNVEKERLKSTFGGYEVEGGGTKSFQPLVIEYRMQTPAGLLVERVILKTAGPQPRAYFVGMVGKRLVADGPDVEHLFSSFHVSQ